MQRSEATPPIIGRCRGQTFRWLLGNDVGYVVTIVVSHEGERDKGGSSKQSALMVHKDALVSYARLFPLSNHSVKTSGSCDNPRP